MYTSAADATDATETMADAAKEIAVAETAIAVADATKSMK
jgi:hypothetical protein